MAHDALDLQELPPRRLEAFPPRPRLIALLAVVLGIAGFAAALMYDADRAWRAYMANWLFWMGIAQGAVMLAAVVTIAKGLWSRPIRRIALSFVAFLPIAWLLMIPLFFVGERVFPWARDPSLMQAGKDVWLNVPFLAVRNLLALGALVAVSIAFAYWALRPDLGRIGEGAPPHLRGLYGRFTRRWRGEAEEDLRAHRRLSVLAPVLAVTYAVAMSLVAWDFAMSLEPHWFSTLIGPYYFMAALLGGVGAVAIAALAYRRSLGLQEILAPGHFHDLGKMIFAFSVFWAYQLWSQYIVIWYGNLPWEQAYLVHRMDPPFNRIAVLVFLLMFLSPFAFLLGVRAKQTPEILATVAGLSLFGLWLERYLLVFPSHYYGETTLPLGWPELVTALPFAGLLIAAVVWFGTRFPMLQMWRPASELELMGVPAPPPAAPVAD
jgi:Ni/Fe-hydrogenase subunit HybB-like protein